MNTNSFQIKGWTVALVSALLAIFASTNNHYFALVGIGPVLLFWCLDAYYLTQERKFRGLYNDVAQVSKEPKEIKLFAMRPDLYVGGSYSYWAVIKSSTICGIYLPVLLLLIFLFVYFEIYPTDVPMEIKT
jgi:hypothetical protein